MNAQPASNERRALLVGISDYERGTNPEDAFGHLNTGPDLANMDYVLKTYYSFPETNITVLVNENATQENIISEFKRQLIDKAKPGDEVVMYYTGHGHFVVDQSGDEITDHLDEVLVTWVPKAKQTLARDKRHALMYMLDDTYEELLRQLIQKMKGADGKVVGSIVVIFDSCHSGSATKGLLVPKGRPWIERIDGRLRSLTTKSEVASGWLSNKQELEDIVFLAASRSDQLSYMMPDSATNGSILTHFLTEFLADAARQNGPNVTYDDLFRWVSFKTASMRAAQTPQIEGRTNAGLFGDGTVIKRSFLPVVQSIESNPLRLQLNTGSLHGVTKGSRFDIYKNGTDVQNHDNKIGEIEIIETKPITSAGVVTKKVQADLPGTAFEAAQAVIAEYRFEGQPLRVFIQPNIPTDKAKALLDAVGPLAFITMNGVTANSYDVMLGWDSDNGNYSYRRATGDIPSPTRDTDTAILKNRLLADWRWRRLANLTLPGPSKVRINLLAADGGALKRTEGGSIILRPGDRAQVLCTNNTRSPVFITLIYLKASGEIETFPGPDEANGQQALNGDNTPRHLFDIENITASRDTEVEILKIIATRRPANFSGISFSEEHGKRRTNGPTNALADVLLGLVDKEAKDVSVRSQDLDEWYTDQVVYEIRTN
ncbi:MAG TPA: caspase family protein [Anaerolineales bacterium]